MINIVIDVIILSGLLMMGVPVPFSFAAAVLYMVFTKHYDPSFLLPAGFFKLSSVVLLAMPLFIIAGGIMSESGIADRLVKWIDSMVGRVKGGLGIITIGTCGFFGAISGTASSAVAAIGSIMIPRMMEHGYDRGFSSALVANSSILALLIPPSASMILYGWATQTSIAACFLATIVPGIILMALLSFWNMVLIRKMPIEVLPKQNLVSTVKNVGSKTRYAAFALIMPVVVLGGIYGGITTPTEAAGVAVIYAILVGFLIYRTLSVRAVCRSLVTSTTTTGVVMLTFFFAMILSRIYTMENVPQSLITLFLSISENKYVILLMINLFLVIIGMLMDDVSGITLASPLLLPIIKELGVHPVQFAAIIGANLGMGNITPPTAPILYLGSRIGNTTLDRMLKPALIFVFGAFLPVVLLSTYVPNLSLFLPRLIMHIK